MDGTHIVQSLSRGRDPTPLTDEGWEDTVFAVMEDILKKEDIPDELAWRYAVDLVCRSQEVNQ